MKLSVDNLLEHKHLIIKRYDNFTGSNLQYDVWIDRDNAKENNWILTMKSSAKTVYSSMDGPAISEEGNINMLTDDDLSNIIYHYFPVGIVYSEKWKAEKP